MLLETSVHLRTNVTQTHRDREIIFGDLLLKYAQGVLERSQCSRMVSAFRVDRDHCIESVTDIVVSDPIDHFHVRRSVEP